MSNNSVSGSSIGSSENTISPVSGSAVSETPVTEPEKTEPNKTENSEKDDPREETVAVTQAPTQNEDSSGISPYAVGGIAVGLIIIGLICWLLFEKKKRKGESYGKTLDMSDNNNNVTDIGANKTEKIDNSLKPVTISSGKIHNIGKRSAQQDSVGMMNINGGIMAVVADGMGGLQNGDAVSQKIIYTMMSDSANRSVAQLSGKLDQMVSHANAEVNQMLGYSEEYVSGSTLIAVLAAPDSFQWISVGDSRIYLYRAGCMLQLNREHVYKAELLERAVNREISFQDAHSHEKGKNVTSFIGMGELKHVDQPLQPCAATRGDRILLTTDGVFNTLSDAEIGEILGKYDNPADAASALEAAVLARDNPHQDNFSSILLFYQ